MTDTSITMERREAFRFRTSLSLLIDRPSGCGKTMFTTKRLLDNTESCGTT